MLEEWHTQLHVVLLSILLFPYRSVFIDETRHKFEINLEGCRARHELGCFICVAILVFVVSRFQGYLWLRGVFNTFWVVFLSQSPFDALETRVLEGHRHLDKALRPPQMGHSLVGLYLDEKLKTEGCFGH